MSFRLVPLWQRSESRLVLFGLSSVLAVYLGFLGLSVAAAEAFVKRGGYYVMLAAFGLFIHALWRFNRSRRPLGEALTRGQRLLVAAAIVLFSLLAILAEPYHGKILNDEFVLQSTAFNMHYFRDVATMVRGYDIQGIFLSTDNYLDKRPYFYPFMVSLVHDLTGYRLNNAFLLNSGLMPVALLLAFRLGRLLTHWRGGLLAVLLLGSLPLLGQNATGSGMELLNVVMILAALVLATEFLRDPTETTFAVFILSVVLLAQARYESALYAGSAALVGVLGWVRSRHIILPWQALLVPLLLVPCALQNKVLSNSPVLWELTQQASVRFSVEYLPGNLSGAVRFLFNLGPEMANSVLLSVLGLGGALWVGGRLALRRPAWHAASPAGAAFFCFSLAILANTLLVFCYYWASFEDRMASRFALPLHLLFTFCAVQLAADWDRRIPASRALLLAAAAFALGVSTGRFAHHYYSHLGIDEIEWTRRYVNSLPPERRLIITNRSSLPWLLEKKPSILISRARLVADRIRQQLRETGFAEILILQSLQPMTAEGDHAIVPEEQLVGFHLQPVAEKRFGSKLTRISRLVDIDDSAMPPPRPTTAASASTSHR